MNRIDLKLDEESGVVSITVHDPLRGLRLQIGSIRVAELRALEIQLSAILHRLDEKEPEYKYSPEAWAAKIRQSQNDGD